LRVSGLRQGARPGLVKLATSRPVNCDEPSISVMG
jgi:hypothetical protein